MKLLTFRPLLQDKAQGLRIGALTEDGTQVVDLQKALEARQGHGATYFDYMIAFLDDFDRAQDTAQEVLEFGRTQQPEDCIVPLADLELLSPVPRPLSVRDCVTFRRHYIQAARTFVKSKSRAVAALDAGLAKTFGRGLIGFPRFGKSAPIYYKSNALTVVGHDAPVYWPAYTEKLDFELEIGVFIGRAGKDIPAADAHKHIAGYAVFNDFSARDIQFQEMSGRLGPTKGKDFDTGNAIGPWLVTPDEVPDPTKLAAQVRVNGETWTRTSTEEMSFSFAELIAYISKDETLYPGEFIGSGTLPDGCGLELDRWIAPGDVVELEVEVLGTLRNSIVTKPKT